MAAPKSAKKKSPATGSGSGASSDIQRLEQILGLMERHSLAEFEWERGSERLRFRAKEPQFIAAPVAPQLSAHAGAVQSVPVAAAPVHAPTVAQAPSSEKAKSNLKQISSPFVGTFYRAASPESDPYVREGQSIKPGQVLCIIEAMKLMNEIEAEISGKVVSILVENGQPVEFGEPLFEIDPAG